MAHIAPTLPGVFPAVDRTSSNRSDHERRRRDHERGAAVVEFAIVAPLLLVLLLGVVEFGLLFGKRLDVSQGAREGARLASVNYQATSGSSGAAQASEIVTATCSRMEVIDNTTITIDVSSGTSIGDTMVFSVSAPAQPVTGMFDNFLAGTVLTSDVEVRLEQPATFATITQACP